MNENILIIIIYHVNERYSFDNIYHIFIFHEHSHMTISRYRFAPSPLLVSSAAQRSDSEHRRV